MKEFLPGTDKRVKALLIVLALIGVYAIGATVWQGYRDYQDFKSMRVWVAQMQQAQRQRAQQQPSAARPGQSQAPAVPQASAPSTSVPPATTPEK